MHLRERIIDYSRGNDLENFWRLYRRQKRAKTRIGRDILTYFLSLHGIFISRYAVVGKGCRIYQNVTIGEVDGRAPDIGDDCLIGAGAVLVGGIRVGNRVRVGAGAVVCTDIPDDCTVVSQQARIIRRDGL